MSKLELKHLAPYLPYGLKSADVCVAQYGLTKPLISDIVPINVTKFIDNSTNAKPILRPLSDLNKEIIINGENHQMWLLINGQKALENGEIENMNGYKYSILELSYSKIQALLKFHIDIFGLIPQGLAVDINTL